MEDIRTSGRNRIFVNKNGERFVNEGAERDTLCKAIFAQPESTYWIVVNKVRYPSETEPDANGATIENMLALEHIVKGETSKSWPQHAAWIPRSCKRPSTATTRRSRVGAEDPFGFKANNTADKQLDRRTLVRLPVRCRPCTTRWAASASMSTPTRSTRADRVVQGLFACGECTGGIHGSNRLGGNAIADCMTFGRNAGKNAAESARATVR